MRFGAVMTAVAGVAFIGAGPVAAHGSGAQPQACGSVAGRQAAWVSCMIRHMSVPERVGQLFMVNAYGTSAGGTTPAAAAANRALYGPRVATISDLIRTYHVGGLIYFGWSNTLASPGQVAALSNSAQRAALGQRPADPLLISIDQEEGYIIRIGPPATVFPGNMALGATRSRSLAYRNAAVTGAELRAMGVNVDNAPVVDVSTNPLNTADGIRSFGDRPGLVSALGAAAVTGYQRPGHVAAVAKHFPGLGDTSTNPDTGVTVSHQSLAQFRAVSFPPFRAAIAAGTDEVMVTSVVARKVDPSGVPAILSRVFVTDILRHQLGFRGLIVTDAMNAQALASYSPGRAAIMAIQAGEDELLYGQQADLHAAAPMSDFVPAYRAVLQAVRSGRLALARIDRSARRVLALKWKLGLARSPSTNPQLARTVAGTPAHLALARRTARASITLLRNRDHLLPLAARPGTKVAITGYSSTAFPTFPALREAFAARGFIPAEAGTGGHCPSSADIGRAVAAARRSQLVLVVTTNVWDTSFCTPRPAGLPQVSLVDALLATRKPVIVAAVGTPYDVAYLPRAATFAATYDPQPVSLDALAAVLFGDVRPGGRLPVTITQPPPSKRVLYPFGYGLSYRQARVPRAAGAGLRAGAAGPAVRGRRCRAAARCALPCRPAACRR